MISKYYIIREHLLPVTVHPVSTFSNNRPTFTSMGLLNTTNNNFLERLRLPVYLVILRSKTKPTENEQHYFPCKLHVYAGLVF